MNIFAFSQSGRPRPSVRPPVQHQLRSGVTVRVSTVQNPIAINRQSGDPPRAWPPREVPARPLDSIVATLLDELVRPGTALSVPTPRATRATASSSSVPSSYSLARVCALLPASHLHHHRCPACPPPGQTSTPRIKSKAHPTASHPYVAPSLISKYMPGRQRPSCKKPPVILSPHSHSAYHQHARNRRAAAISLDVDVTPATFRIDLVFRSPRRSYRTDDARFHGHHGRRGRRGRLRDDRRNHGWHGLRRHHARGNWRRCHGRFGHRCR